MSMTDDTAVAPLSRSLLVKGAGVLYAFSLWRRSLQGKRKRDN